MSITNDIVAQQRLLFWHFRDTKCTVHDLEVKPLLGGTLRGGGVVLLSNWYMLGACGPVDRALDSRSEGLGFGSQCWSCVEVLGKLCIPHCPGLPSRNGYLVHRSKVGLIVAGCIGTHLARGKVKSVEHALSWSLDSKQLPLPLPLLEARILIASAPVNLRACAFEITSHL